MIVKFFVHNLTPKINVTENLYFGPLTSLAVDLFDLPAPGSDTGSAARQAVTIFHTCEPDDDYTFCLVNVSGRSTYS